VADGRVFAVTVDNELKCLGGGRWQAPVGALTAFPETAACWAAPAPRSPAKSLIAPYTSGELFAAARRERPRGWTDNLAATRNVNAVAGLANIRGRPVIDHGRVFAVSHSGRTASIDLRSGDRVWEQQIASSHSPWVVGDYVFVLANDNELVCLTHKEGKVRWVRRCRASKTRRRNPTRSSGPGRCSAAIA